jgi:hypothetical protein
VIVPDNGSSTLMIINPSGSNSVSPAKSPTWQPGRADHSGAELLDLRNRYLVCFTRPVSAEELLTAQVDGAVLARYSQIPYEVPHCGSSSVSAPRPFRTPQPPASAGVLVRPAR